MNSIGVTGSNGPGPCPSGYYLGLPDDDIKIKFSNRFEFGVTTYNKYTLMPSFNFRDKMDNFSYKVECYLPELESHLNNIIISKRDNKINSLLD